jgi:hypothetical protein
LKTPFSLPHRAAAPGDDGGAKDDGNDGDQDSPKPTAPVTPPHPQ